MIHYVSVDFITGVAKDLLNKIINLKNKLNELALLPSLLMHRHFQILPINSRIISKIRSHLPVQLRVPFRSKFSALKNSCTNNYKLTFYE